MKRKLKPWKQPKLIILERTTLAESVLVFCKTGGPTGTKLGPAWAFAVCHFGFGNCAYCSTDAPS